MAVRHLADRVDVDDPHQRVRRRFQPHQAGVRCHRLLDRVEVGGVHRRERDAEPSHHLVKEPKRAPVDVLHVDDVIVGLEQEHERRLGAEPRCECKAVARLLERGQAFLQRLPSWVAAARVLESVMLADALLGEGGGEAVGSGFRRDH